MKSRAASSLRSRNLRLGALMGIFFCAMVGLSFAAVPLYDMFCRATGFGGRTQQSGLEDVLERGAGQGAQKEQDKVRVRFDANVSVGLDWEFRADQTDMTVPVGEVFEATYTAENLSDRSLVGVATYNVTPQKAGAYFHKIACFCFTEQTLKKGERVTMKVVFFVDPQLLEREDWGSFDTITLSYSFFPRGDGGSKSSMR